MASRSRIRSARYTATPRLTKLDLGFRYYESVAALIMPHLADRRVALPCLSSTAPWASASFQ